MKKSSYTSAEAMLAKNFAERERIMFRPLHAWTEQDTTDQILDKKQMMRDRYGWEIDFDDYKLPFMKNVAKKMEKLGPVEA